MEKVLIIKLGALGDIVMSLPLLKQIQQHHQNAQISLLTSLEYEHIFQGWPGLIVHSFPRKGIRASLQTLGWLRKQNFRCLYDLQSNDRTGFICAFSGVPLRVGNHTRFPYHRHPKEKYVGQNHIFERMLEVLRANDINAKNDKPFLPTSKEDQEKVERWLEQNSLNNDPIVIMHAGGSPQHPAKRWPYFGELAKTLEQSGYLVVWVGTDIDAELNRSLAESSGIDASNIFSLKQLIALGKKALFAVTNDSGPMHVLSCCDIPIYGLFGPTNWRRNHAVGQKEHVISLGLKEEVFAPSSLEKLTVNAVIDRLKADRFL